MQTQTSPEIYAQTAAFIDASSEGYKTILAHQIGKVAASLEVGESVIVSSSDAGLDGDGLTLSPTDLETFLHTATQETQDDITFLANKIAAFDRFIKGVNSVRAGRGRVLSTGQSNATARELVQDGKHFAVKFGGYSFEAVRAFRRGESIARVAHLEAVDPDNDIFVMDLVPDRLMTALTFKERAAIPTDHIISAIDKVIEMNKAGLRIDPHPGNLLYDTKVGFGFVDYAIKPSHEPWPHYRSQANQVMLWADMFALFPKLEDIDTGIQRDTPEYAELLTRMGQHRVLLYSKFLDVMEEHYPHIIHEAVDEGGYSLARGINGLPEGNYLDEFKARLRGLGLNSGEGLQHLEIDTETL